MHPGQYPRQPVIGTSIYDGSEVYFSSLAEAAAQGFCRDGVAKCLKGIFKQSGGFTWRKWT